jgi:hypothetical protein
LLSVLFWNLDKNSATFSHIVRLAQSRALDIIFLAEPPDDVTPLLVSLNGARIGRFRDATLPPLKIRIITKLSSTVFKHRHTNQPGDVGICSVTSTLLREKELLLAPVHLPSKWGGKSPAGQASVAIEVAKELADFESRRRHSNTIAFGDFNMNPFDPGMTMVTGMHALMTGDLARQPDRLHRGVRYGRFYNPMWGLFGDRTDGPAGTYYWRSSEIENYHWAMLDQILVRPSLIGAVQDLDILDHDGTDSLFGEDRAPSKDYLSDHLPIAFRVNI